MKKALLLMAALFAATLLFSCQRIEELPAVEEEEPAAEQEPVAEPVTRTFICSFASAAPESDSKVSISEQGKTRWEAGDQIMVHGGNNGAVFQVVTLSAEDISADGKTATITVEDMAPYDRTADNILSGYFAQYPASAVPTGGPMYYECCFNSTNHFLMAACDVEDKFVFYNLCGIISYKVEGDFDQVLFSGHNGETVGYDYYQVRVRNDADGLKVVYHKPGNGYKTYTEMKTLTADVAADGQTVNYLCLPAGANFTGGFIMKFLKDGDIVQTVSTRTAVNVKAGSMLPMGDISRYLVDYVPPTSHDATHPAIDGARDLGADETANCYIVDGSAAGNAGKVFKFKAVKGNGDESVGDVASAEVLWESWNNDADVTAGSVIAAVDYDLQEGSPYAEICFQMPETLQAGNAVIVARDSHDTILWSWHIWVPGTAIETSPYGLYPANIMDRNLGALVAATTAGPAPIESFGLLYQWGRKDPFMNAQAVSSKYNATVSGTELTQTEGSGEADESKISLSTSIASPTLMGHAKDGDWILPTDNNLWVNDQKTIYDPCPPGYRVPACKTSQPLHSSDYTTVTGWQESADNYWFTLGSPVAVFPFAGYRDDYDVLSPSHPYDRAAIWTSQSSSDDKAYYMNVRLGGYHKLASVGKSRACSVRCVSEQEVAPEPSDYPVMAEVLWSKKLKKSDTDFVVELSGLCLSQDGDFLWGVGDNGDLYKIGFDGTYDLHWSYDADMEGLCLDPATGTMYMGIEPDRVYKVPAPNYNSKTTLFEVEEASEMSNSGIEGIAWHNGNLYLGAQTGATLWEYKLDGTKLSKKSLRDVAPTLSEIAGLDYDPVNDYLWVMDSNGSSTSVPDMLPYTLYLFNGDATELLATYDLSSFADWNPESVCVDRANGCIWVADDCGDGDPSILHKIKFYNL